MQQLSQDELQQMLHTAAREGAQTALEASDAFVHLDNYTSNHSEISDMSKEENDDMSRNRTGHHSHKGCAGYTCPLQAMGCVSRALPDLSCHRKALRHTGRTPFRRQRSQKV